MYGFVNDINKHFIFYQERTLQLDQSIKIGRSVARARPSATNAIFDCKVLSRNHALLWYETGKFYLQDTKVSDTCLISKMIINTISKNTVLYALKY